MSRRASLRAALALAPLALLAAVAAAQDALPAPPAPRENPVTEAKRVLGKILFWDEQLSSDDTVSCGTCHFPERAGTDARLAVQSGPDGVPGNADDIAGSPGIVAADAAGDYTNAGVAGLVPQITGRAANAVVMAQYAPDLFWDGRATSQFRDPVTGAVAIAAGGALESQAVGPPLSDVEMAHARRDWPALTDKIAAARPLALAAGLPSDVASALAAEPSYPDLFEDAFGDDEVTATRIAFAIATYERTLVPDQTPWDAFQAGDAGALTARQRAGLTAFRARDCGDCHDEPHFTDHSFRNIGVRPVAEDEGRSGVTGANRDRGRFKVPTLRNAGLKRTFMHNGQFQTLEQVLRFYAKAPGTVQFDDNLDPLIPPLRVNPGDQAAIVDLIRGGLTDPRVRDGTFPFDRPTLFAERVAQFIAPQGGGTPGLGGLAPRVAAVTPPLIGSDTFKAGLERGRAGASAILAVSRTDPSGGDVTPELSVGPLTVSADGVATAHLPLAADAFFAGDVLYVQWHVSDAAAAGGSARSGVVRLTLLGGADRPVDPDPDPDPPTDTPTVDGDAALCVTKVRLAVLWSVHERDLDKDTLRLVGRLNPRGAAGDLSDALVTLTLGDLTLLDGVVLDGRGRSRGDDDAGKYRVAIDAESGTFDIRFAARDLRALLADADANEVALAASLQVTGAGLAVEECAGTLVLELSNAGERRTRGRYDLAADGSEEGAFQVRRIVARDAGDGTADVALRALLAAPDGAPLALTGDVVVTFGDAEPIVVTAAQLRIGGAGGDSRIRLARGADAEPASFLDLRNDRSSLTLVAQDVAGLGLPADAALRTTLLVRIEAEADGVPIVFETEAPLRRRSGSAARWRR